MNPPLVAGNMVSLCSPLVLTPLVTLLKPDNFDWWILKEQIHRGDDEHVTVSATNPEDAAARTEQEGKREEENDKALITARNRSLFLGLFLTISLVILWPIPMYASSYVFSVPFFTGWVAFLFIWAFLAAGVILVLPIWEGLTEVKMVLNRILGRGFKERSTHIIVLPRECLDREQSGLADLLDI